MSDLTERARARAKSLNEGGGQWEFVEADDWNALCDTIDRLIAENERLEVEAIAMHGRDHRCSERPH